jgi:hypothetical protein
MTEYCHCPSFRKYSNNHYSTCYCVISNVQVATSKCWKRPRMIYIVSYSDIPIGVIFQDRSSPRKRSQHYYFSESCSSTTKVTSWSCINFYSTFQRKCSWVLPLICTPWSGNLSRSTCTCSPFSPSYFPKSIMLIDFISFDF